HALYNVASGSAHSGEEILATICAVLERPVPETRTDPDLIRPNDPASITGDAERLRRETGWVPRIPFARMIAESVSSV
ncbi:hypothetical protein ABTD78_25785, partial [Acinetobacter baumannii]